MSAAMKVVSLTGLPKDRYMGNPQLEDGFTRISNELIDAILLHGLTQRQMFIVLAIIRKTYGFNKKADDISSSQLAAICHMNRGHVSTTLNQLAKMNVINKAPGVHGSILSIQKNYKLWIELEEEDKDREKKPFKITAGNHYTYILTYPETGEFYIGVRSCKCHPNQDRYKGSGNWTFSVPKTSLEKKVVKTFESRSEAEKHEIELIHLNLENDLMRNQRRYLNGTGCSESEHGVQKKTFAASESEQIDGSESEHTKDNLTKDNQKTVNPAAEKSAPISIHTWLSAMKAKGEKAIAPEDTIFKYADEAGITDDMLRLCWLEFREQHIANKKRKKDWRAHFRNSVRMNWYRIWAFDGEGKIFLTSQGRQAMAAFKGEDA